MRPARRVHLPAAVAVLVLSGCQAVTGAVDSASVRDHEDLRGDLVASGLGEDETDCIMAEPEDLFEPGNAALPDASAKAFAACGVEQRGVEDIPEEDLRRAFVAGFAQASGATQQEAGCVFDTMVDRGIPPVDFAGQTLSPEADRALPAVLEECGVQG